MNKRHKKASSAPWPSWIDLPGDLTANILRRLSPVEILDTAERVCTTWRSVCLEPSFRRVFHMTYSDNDKYSRDDADRLCRLAVDRSQGELIDINIKNFATDNLLQYISQRSIHLKVLSLEPFNISGISGIGLTTAVKNFARLEELHLFGMPLVGAEDIKTIGDSCPMLKSFTLYRCYLMFFFPCTNNYKALSIATKMPNLSRLRLVCDNLDNEGLLAILNGCPNLESLELSECTRLRFGLGCDIGMGCSEHIKELKGLLEEGYFLEESYYESSRFII